MTKLTLSERSSLATVRIVISGASGHFLSELEEILRTERMVRSLPVVLTELETRTPLRSIKGGKR